MFVHMVTVAGLVCGGTGRVQGLTLPYRVKLVSVCSTVRQATREAQQIVEANAQVDAGPWPQKPLATPAPMAAANAPRASAALPAPLSPPLLPLLLLCLVYVKTRLEPHGTALDPAMASQ